MRNRMLCGLIILLAVMTSGISRAEDPNEPDTVIVGSAICDAGEQVIVRIHFFNDEELGAITLPLKWNSPDISLTKVSYPDSSRVAYVSYKSKTIDNVNQTVISGCVVMSEDYVQPGTGLMCELIFDVPPGTPDQIISIDTTTIPPAAYLLFSKADGSTFVPKFEAGRIIVGDPPLPPHIELSPESMIFEGITGYPNPAAQTLTIRNTGEQDLDWTAAWSSDWLSVSPSSGTALSYSSIRPDISGLADGTYYDTVVISCPEADNSPQLLPVRLEVITLPPNIVYSPSQFLVSAVLGEGNPDDRHLSIWTGVIGSELNWTVTNSSDWLTLTPASGSPPDSVTLQFDVSGLPFGLHYDTITISDPAAVNDPRLVPVTLQIVSDLPVLSVPDTVYLIAETGTSAIAVVPIDNQGAGVMTYAVTEDCARITNVYPMSGTAPQDVEVSFKSQVLGPGHYYDSIIVSSPEAINSPQIVVTHLYMSDDPPLLYAGPEEIDLTYFTCWQGMDPDSVWASLQILNMGSGMMLWQLDYNALWLILSRTSGFDDGFVTLNPRPNMNLAAGIYEDTITVTADYALQSPRTVIVRLTVIEGTEDPEMVVNQMIVDIPAQEVFGIPGGDPIETAQILNYHPGCMDYWIEEDIPWLTFIDSSGGAPAIPRSMVEIGSYTYGVYPNTFWIHSASAVNAPVSVDVNLLVWRLHGDNDWSNGINVGDIVYLVNYVFKNGPEPQPTLIVGDVNCDDAVNVGDIYYLIEFVFWNGNPPCGNP